MIYYKTAEEIELIRESSLLLSKTLAEIGGMIRPGITGKALDKRAEEFILDHGATPAFKGFNGFPFSLCISPNDQVVHGFPSDNELKEGEIIRSEERRVGKEWVSTCRSRRSPYH